MVIRTIFLLCCWEVTLASSTEMELGSWLGPSRIKASVEHGFGMGIYTGKHIAKGTVMPSELMIPVYDFDEEDEQNLTRHPPLREYLWEGNDFKALVLESLEGMLFFSPGLASIAPCTSNNFNLERIDKLHFLQDSLVSDGDGIDRAKEALAGAFTYYQIEMFRAVRDIQPGEELVVECLDDDFDADVFQRETSQYSQYSLGYDPMLHTCLDDKVERKNARQSNKGDNLNGSLQGQGLFAKTKLFPDSRILSSPAVPIHRDLLVFTNDSGIQRTQLLMNYCFGHPESDLLWLPFGPLVSSINHASTNPNVKVVWHEDPIPNENLDRRQQYHHTELLDFAPDHVWETHGKGLMMDIVALRSIEPGEELVLDYGQAWSDAWKQHEEEWPQAISEITNKYGTSRHVTAWEHNGLYSNDSLRTITEQHRNPYPQNILTACRFQEDWIEDEFAEDYAMIQYQSWKTQQDHFQCLLPCIILERYEDEDNRDGPSGTSNLLYTAKLVDHHHENENIEYSCHIFRRFEYIYTDIPRHGIEFIENVYTSDTFLPMAFRQNMEMSEGSWPHHWNTKRNKLRRRPTFRENDSPAEDGTMFKRKIIEPKADTQRKREASPRSDL